MPRQSFGIICLCVFLVLTGIALLTNIQIAAYSILLGIFALAAAVLLFLGK